MANFKTKARSVDLLGKQQIRDEVTAIYELLRNSYDADAGEALIDINTKQKRIIVLDDGEGMTENDLEENWLTLGTYSKYDRSKVVTKKNRVKVGEKGIGRLAISLLGDQLLLISKKENLDTWSLLYIHWELFRNEQAFLEQITIPTKNFDNKEQLILFLDTRLGELKEELLKNLSENSHVWRPDISNRIIKEVNEFEVTKDMINSINWINHRGKGTLFFISNIDQDIDWHIFKGNTEDESLKKRVQRLKDIIFSFKNLIDLFDNIKEKKNNLRYDRELENKEEAQNNNRDFEVKIHIDNFHLENESWFNTDDVQLFDYALKGTIVEGNFIGEALVNTDTGHLTFSNSVSLTQGMNWSISKDCGPIKIKWFFVEGRHQLSSLPKDQHKMMIDKLNEIGGIYVFRDGIRILPYGEPGNDFLFMEERRSKGSSYYLFSHRRMFGYMEISKNSNPLLIDKSSREGFIENSEFNYFRHVAINLLKWWAQDFLESTRKDGLRLKRVDQLLQQRQKEREKLEAQKIEEAKEKEYFYRLEQKLSNFDTDINRTYSDILDSIYRKTNKYLDKNTPIQITDESSTVSLINNIKKPLQDIIRKIDQYSFMIHPRYNHSLEQIELMNDYNRLISEKKLDLQRILDENIGTILNIITEQDTSDLESLRNKVQGAINWTSKPNSFIDQVTREPVTRLTTVLSELNKQVLSTVEKKIHEISIDKQALVLECNNISLRLRTLNERLNTLEFFMNPDEIATEAELLLKEFNDLQHNFYREIDTLTNRIKEIKAIQQIEYLLKSSIINLENGIYESDDKLIGLLKREVEMYRDLSSVGLAAELTSHEFNALHSSIHQNIDVLHKALQNTRLLPQIDKTRKAFHSLERLHQRMSPLYRQSRYKKQEIILHDFIRSVIEYFRSDIERYNIIINISVPKNIVVLETEAVLFTPLVNLLSNSIYWLLDRHTREIHYYITNEQNKLFIQDSGPGITDNDQERVFEPFFTKKVSGRGLGLFLSKDILLTKGHNLQLIPHGEKPQDLSGACFCIEFKKETITEVASLS